MPRAGPGEALLRVQASDVNFIDIHLRRGDYTTTLPFTPGTEVVGTVEAIGGDGAAEFALGDRVAFLTRTGGYAQYVVAPLERLIPVGGAPVEAVMSLFQGITAEYLVHDVHPIRAGETMLVHSAAGGIGTMLVQYAKVHRSSARRRRPTRRGSPQSQARGHSRRRRCRARCGR